MKHYNKIIAGVIIFWLILSTLASALLYFNDTKPIEKGYRIDINRINKLLSEGIDLKDIDLREYKYVVNVETLTLPCSDKELSAFFNGEGIPGGVDFSVQPFFSNIKNQNSSNNVLYYLRFTYQAHDDTDFILKTIIIINLSLFIMVVLVTSIMLFIKRSILRPFNQIIQMPYELSKGHLKVELKESKNRFFGKFVWGLELLRQNLETHKKRELQLEKEKKTMILSLSHDIKTPLSTIKLYSKAIYDNLYRSEQKKAEAARNIEEKANQIESFVGEIIAASTGDIFDIQVTQGEFYLSKLVYQTRNTYEDKLRILKTDFIIDSFDEILLRGDMERLLEVLENIIENAIKYGDGRYIKISFTDEDYCKLITVTNSGQPISSTEFIHMFESFWRGANSRNKDGSGLGLYICKEIMKKMDGDIFAENTADTMSITVVVRYC